MSRTVRSLFTPSRHLMLATNAAMVCGLAIVLAGSSPMPSAADATTAPSAQPRLVRTSMGPGAGTRAAAVTGMAAQEARELAQRTSDASAASLLFASHSWYVAPPAPPPPPPAAPVAPTAPPLPYSFVGSYAPVGSDAVYFLTRGERVYDVKPGATLDGIYTFDGAENGQLVFTYKPLNVRQTLAMGGGT